MFNFHQNQNPIIEAVQQIYLQTKNSALSETRLENCSSSISTLSCFFECTDEQAVLLAILLQLKIENSDVSIKDIINHADLTISHASYINNVLSSLVDKDWLCPKQNVLNFPLTRYSINLKLVRSVLLGSLEINDSSKIENSYQLLNQFKALVGNRHSKFITYESFIDAVTDLISTNSAIDLSDFILKRSLSKYDTAYFMYHCSRYYFSDESASVDDMIRELAPTRDLHYDLRRSMHNSSNKLMVLGLLKESSVKDLIGTTTYVLTEKAIHAFDKEFKQSRKSSEGLLQQLEPSLIIEQKLIFDSNEQVMVDKLHTMLDGSHYSKLTARLESQGLRKGINVLLYGHPGTGKTEAVLQLGKQSNRYILQADASKLRNKWVGDTEKNIKALFVEYRHAMQEYAETPILLFNEADAILGKRQTVNDRVDQMENSMQNILLQELENFEGIFIATTNLVDNLDKAFDRRFLYKIKFDKPCEQTLLQIWKTKFPNLKTSVLKNVCAKFSLTGGQIENIRKKVVVDSLFDEKLKLNESYLSHLAEQELMLEKKKERNPIGFMQKKNKN